MKKNILLLLIIILISVLIILKINSRKDHMKNIELTNSIIESIDDNQNSIKVEESYIETVPNHAKKFIELLEDDKIILTKEQISQYNDEIKKKADMMYDIYNIHSLSEEEIFQYINTYNLPALPKYYGDITLTESNTKSILDNRNMSQIYSQKQITKGIIVKRANLRSFPTDISFYDKKTNQDYDRLQETELHVNTPVLVIHESKDDIWNFVISPFYIGWTKKENIALATENDFEFFIGNDNFGIITESILEIENTLLDMSVRLPYMSTTQEGYNFILPQKGSNNYVEKKQVIIPRDKAHIGYLPYTKKNVYIQAFKYEGVKYSWGGKDIGVDCSSYVSNIYRSFGFMLPRNTSNQNESVGKTVLLTGKTPNQKLEIIKQKYPVLLYQSGHVMLYLGEIENKNYMIHASGTEMKVTMTELTKNSKYIDSINKIVIIE